MVWGGLPSMSERPIQPVWDCNTLDYLRILPNFHCRRGQYSPFGIATQPVACYALCEYYCRRGQYSPFGIATFEMHAVRLHFCIVGEANTARLGLQLQVYR